VPGAGAKPIRTPIRTFEAGPLSLSFAPTITPEESMWLSGTAADHLASEGWIHPVLGLCGAPGLWVPLRQSSPEAGYRKNYSIHQTQFGAIMINRKAS
jgi:hypothetical protein